MARVLAPCNGRFKGGVGAVSYTHLDVYKRQLLYCFVFVGRVRFMPRLKVKNTTKPALIRTTAAKHVPACKPARKHQRVRRRNIELLAVELLFF